MGNGDSFNLAGDLPSDLAGLTWAKVAPALDRQLAPLGESALDALAPKKGEHVVDVGCGAGQTCVQLADAVGPSGSVFGIDISPALVSAARDRTQTLPQVQIVEADAQAFDFAPKTFDTLFSRFGVMAFQDPVAAFSNFHRALKPKGRLAFVCWQPLEKNAIDHIPLNAAIPVLPASLTKDLSRSHPFSFAKPDQVKRILEEAGFHTIDVVAHAKTVDCGDEESALDLALSVGPLGKIVRENPSVRDRVRDPVRRALEKWKEPRGIFLKAAVWVVTAKASPED